MHCRTSSFRRKRNSGRIRTRLAAWLAGRAAASKTGAHHVDVSRCAKSLRCSTRTIKRAINSIRGRSQQWMHTHKIYFVADFQHGYGKKQRGRRRLIVYHARTLVAGKAHLSDRGGRHKHCRLTWSHHAPQVNHVDVPHLGAIEGLAENSMETPAPGQPSFYYWKQVTTLRPKGQSDDNKVLRTEDRAAWRRGCRSKTGFSSGGDVKLSWYLGSICLDLLSEGGVAGANLPSLTSFCHRWVREGIHRDAILEALNASMQNKQVTPQIRSHCALVIWDANCHLLSAIENSPRSQRIRGMYCKIDQARANRLKQERDCQKVP